MTANVPYAFAFIAAQSLALPGLALALYLHLIRRVAGSGGWLRACFELMFSGVVLLPFVLLCFATLLITGMSASARPWAALVLVFINIGGAATAFTMTPPKDTGDLLVWLPALASTAISGLLGWRVLPV